ncbi:putative cathepsin B6 cysteine protease [Monocercomonoides exilis]|uniref:putative cathepsin B6 cysteine protease n=1 Tax=Monocercomonoides exilis TaxID=2049356 RepID=UPI003559AEA3|nr:putative cathepsin B6 cysteine protease [Monocercomonoides exilis]|eukprot:MONOS_2947.1-p1 / transcript=MONOS_2947.1 / gene=MONOS_2947 / organism=Monocercomonoides_exilis_PA203 / gene_product=cathepsin B6 cysteine protease / transcript_product=cathepsin B6 cysteine protease / location=Mono_scaffold00064:141226-141939(-) / protein_length=237 / sequence_SO=supercontig / SO=protein_coding / is_pseudo=false
MLSFFVFQLIVLKTLENKGVNSPPSFDIRYLYPANYFEPVPNEGRCPISSAFAAASQLAIRRAKKGYEYLKLSAQYIISCQRYTCNSQGSGYDDMRFLDSGIPSESCFPYVSNDGRVPQCPSKCVNGGNFTKYRASDYSTSSKEVEKIKMLLVDDGPMLIKFSAGKDFYNYRRGIYTPSSNDLSRSALLIGWGMEGNVPFWLCQNSMGTRWGENGYFRLIADEGHSSNYYFYYSNVA